MATSRPTEPRRPQTREARSGASRVLGSLLLVAVLAAAVPRTAVAALSAHASPKIANYYLHWTIDELDARELARWDLLILDMELQERSPEMLREIRRRNPDVVILAYITAGEIRTDAAQLSDSAPLRAKLANRIQQSWYLKDAGGNRRTFWPGTWILNVTNRSPAANGERWQDVLPRFVKEEVMSSGMWDGVFFDNGWDDITYFAHGPVDLDGDGRNETAADANRAWQEGLRQIYRRAREVLDPDYYVFQNDGPMYYADVQGQLFENFPKGDWTLTQQQIQRTARGGIPPAVPILNSNTGNTGRFTEYGNMRFGLASALLNDAYFSYDYGDQDHGQWFYYDEYDANLGRAVGSARRVDGASGNFAAGVWRRDFERGAAVVNAGGAAKTVALGGDFEKLRGTQDPRVNDGSIVDEVRLVARDAVILRKPLEDVTGGTFPNGAFTRMFNREGVTLRNGFFVSDARFGAGETVIRTDLDGDGAADVVGTDGRRVRILLANGRSANLLPYGDKLSGRINIAVGDVTGDGAKEIVTAPATTGNALIRIWSLDGREAAPPFHAYDPRFPGGASVAVGNLDGEGKEEIVTGAGPGGGPHVRVFSGDGRVRDRGFFAYDPRFRGGISVAVGELTGDGRAEIVTGAGPGGGPHVRVFSGTGTPRGQGFFALDRRNTAGISVTVTDVDNNNSRDILVFTRDLTLAAELGSTAVAVR
ncbi:hypothetical protein EPO33_02820 [Patescibacteria group bacterium]|nr:MAG: hypothetical protein EPO33_02820 [Patescibacteria group bacterium]